MRSIRNEIGRSVAKKYFLYAKYTARNCKETNIKPNCYIYIADMLFKNQDGEYIEILRKNYKTDTAYYTAIMKVRYDKSTL